MTRQSYSVKEIDLVLECKDISEFLRRHAEMNLCPERTPVSLYAIWNTKSTYRKIRAQAAADVANHTVTLKTKSHTTPAGEMQKSLEEYAVDRINILKQQTAILNEILAVQKETLSLFKNVQREKSMCKPGAVSTGSPASGSESYVGGSITTAKQF